MISLRANLLRCCSLAIALMVGTGCREKLEPIVSDFNETFERSALGASWRDTGGKYRIERGELTTREAQHHPLWLRRRLPKDVSIEFDVHTPGQDGDIRVVLFGDGKSTNPNVDGCQSSGYELVFGGWKNQLSVICRAGQADGGHQRARSDWPVIPDRTYHFYITRKDGIVAWYIDGHEMLTWTDPDPLIGPEHEAFGFDGGRSEVYFDNLVVGPYHP